MKTRSQSTFSLLAFFIKAYPIASAMVVGALFLAGLAETLGIGALLPLITLVIGGDQSPNNALADLLMRLFDFAGIEPTLTNLLITIAVTISLKAVIVFQAMRFVSYVSTDVTRDFRLKLIKSLMNARWTYFTGLSIGKISNTVSAEAARAGHCYMLAGRTAAALIQSLIYIAAAFLVSWQVSLLALVMGGLVGFLVKGFIRMARKAGGEMTQHTNNMIAELNDSLSGIKPLKAMGQESHYLQKLDVHTTHVMKAQKAQSLSNLLLQIVYEPIAVILLAAGLFYVLTYTTTPVASVLLLAFLFYRMMTQANLLQNFYQNMVQNEAAVWGMLDEIGKADAERELLPAGDEPVFHDKIKIDNISISYDADKTIFDHFSADIPKAKITTIFGPSGAGKTSLIDAILGLIPVQDGSINVDGKPLTDIDLREWRHKIGYVPQETFLFHDTISQNVTLGDTKYSDDDVRAALEKADALKFVNELPKNIASITGERGGKLSGGQRQRIALARALIRKPEILIMDESTTGLDQQSEDEILKALKKVSDEITVIMISHDPKILDIADHVIRLDKKD